MNWQRSVKPLGQALGKSLVWWYREHYHLTANDPRLLETTFEQMALDFWADYYHRRPHEPDIESFESDDFEADVEAMLADDGDDAEEWEEVP